MTADLRERILSGSGPDRELDALVWVEFRGRTEKRTRAECATPPPYTAYEGVGHCIALMGEVLPGWGWLLMSEGLVTRAELLPPYFSPTDNPNSIAATHEELPRAILAAFTDAKAQEAG